MKNIKFYLDFDGTITRNDVVDMLLDRFADKAWQAVEKEWQAGKIGSRECLERQVALLKMSPEDLEKLCQEVVVDSHFTSFLKTVQKAGCQTTIVSDGFDLIIESVLKRHLSFYPQLLKALPIFSNRLELVSGGARASFLSAEICEHGCANCKPRIIQKMSGPEDVIFFVGDGWSDRFAAQVSQKTFAKEKLLHYCRDHKLDVEPYSDFGEIEQWFLKNKERFAHAVL